MTRKNAEEVKEVAEENIDEAPEPSEFIEVTVEGIDLKIQRKKLGSWKYLMLLKKQIEANQALVTAPEGQRAVPYGKSMDVILDHLGDLASYSEVMAFYHEVIKAIRAKN